MASITCGGCGAPMFFPQVEGEKYTCACGVGSLSRGFGNLHPPNMVPKWWPHWNSDPYIEKWRRENNIVAITRVHWDNDPEPAKDASKGDK